MKLSLEPSPKWQVINSLTAHRIVKWDKKYNQKHPDLVDQEIVLPDDEIREALNGFTDPAESDEAARAATLKVFDFWEMGRYGPAESFG